MTKGYHKIEQFTQRLIEATTLGGTEPLSSSQFQSLLQEAGQSFSNSNSAAFEWALGGGWYVYTFQNLRGDARKEGYENAIEHWERGHALGKANGGPEFIKHTMLLGRLYVEQAIVRNSQRAIELYAEIYDQVRGYEPLLLGYAEGLYQTGNFEQAIVVAMELHRRAKKEYRRAADFPPAALHIAAKAYRASIKHYKKEKLYNKALEVSTQFLASDAATEADEKVHTQLLELAEKSKT